MWFQALLLVPHYAEKISNMSRSGPLGVQVGAHTVHVQKLNPTTAASDNTLHHGFS